MSTTDVDYKTLLKQRMADGNEFVKLTLSKPLSPKNQWVRVIVRPVLLRGLRALQFSYFDGKKDISQNFEAGADTDRALDEAIAAGFGQVHLQGVTGDVQVLVSRKGHAHVSHTKPAARRQRPELDHDHIKQQPLMNLNTPFLRRVGIVNKTGLVRQSMRGKLNQINEFLRIIDQYVGEGSSRGDSFTTEDTERTEKSQEKAQTALPHGRTLHIIDCGCGSAYLTFAAHYYLNDVCGIPARVTGVDVNPDVIAKSVSLRDSLGWKGLEFHVAQIAEFEPAEPPDIVLSLHACDTATDEALARAIRWQSRVILAAPCCQHELNDQLESDVLRPMIRYGIQRERMADMVTDTLRALVLRIHGYRTDIVEFTSPESTAKNLMIRAERLDRRGDVRTLVKEYEDLKAFWHVTPAIEKMVGAVGD